jgi:hypothetical protein
VHFATVEHQDNQADDKGTGQFEGACPHQRDEAERTAQYGTNQADKLRMLMPSKRIRSTQE